MTLEWWYVKYDREVRDSEEHKHKKENKMNTRRVDKYKVPRIMVKNVFNL